MASNHWLKLKLVGTKSNRSAIGARVVVRYGKKSQAQEVLSQSSFYSVNDTRLHFGLGSEKTADIAIRWPSGAHEELKGVSADQLIVVKEGTGIVAGSGLVKTRRVMMPCAPARLHPDPSREPGPAWKKPTMLRFATLE